MRLTLTVTSPHANITFSVVTFDPYMIGKYPVHGLALFFCKLSTTANSLDACTLYTCSQISWESLKLNSTFFCSHFRQHMLPRSKSRVTFSKGLSTFTCLYPRLVFAPDCILHHCDHFPAALTVLPLLQTLLGDLLFELGILQEKLICHLKHKAQV